jgi:hypothetical protein
MKFAPKHVVAMVVSICAAVVLAPVGVMAATGQLVNIADPVIGTRKAQVSSDGRLWVDARAGASTNTFSFATDQLSGNVFVKLFEATGPRRVALTEVSFAAGLLNTTNGYAFRATLWGLARTTGTAACALNAPGWTARRLRTVEVPINDSVAVSFAGTPLLVPAAASGQPMCLGVYIDRTITSAQLFVGGTGYTYAP